MNAVLEAQRSAFMAELPVTMAARKDRLRRLGALCRDHAEALTQAIQQDFGARSREQTLLTDIGPSVGAVNDALKHIERWAKREKRSPPFPLGLLGAKAWVEWRPKGVVGVIAPWNFPVYLAVSPIAGAFAAGNRAMLKPSEATPATAAVLAELVAAAFDVSELAVFPGGVEVGQQFAALPFDHLVFTGATGIARHILHAAADNLTPVTLELGGKSPAVIGTGADLAKAAQRIAAGKLMNAGQACVAPDYVLVAEAQEGAFVEAVQASAAALFPATLPNPDATAIVSERHHARLTGLVEDARDKGARIVEVNPAGEDFAASNQRKLPLTLVLDPTDDMAVMQQEVFGPVLPVRRYSGINEAISYINAHDRPLALYHFGPDKAERQRLLDRTLSGGVTLDDVVFHVGIEDLPFGGIGASGMGAYHGRDGFRTFSHAQAVFQQSPLNVGRLAGLHPPYNAATMRTIKRMMGR